MVTEIGKYSKQEIEHNGSVYDVVEIYKHIAAGNKPFQSVVLAYPELRNNPLHAKKVAAKVRIHPYFKARKDATLDIIAARDADLQLNMLDLAFGARSEKVRFDATKDSLDRVHGAADDGSMNKERPILVFNFGVTDGTPQKAVRRVVGEKPARDANEAEVIDVD